MKKISFLNQEVELNLVGYNEEGEIEIELDHLLNGRQLKIFLTPEEGQSLSLWLLDLSRSKPLKDSKRIVDVIEPEELNFIIPEAPDPTKEEN